MGKDFTVIYSKTPHRETSRYSEKKKSFLGQDFYPGSVGNLYTVHGI
jgi:hypothetical protein